MRRPLLLSAVFLIATIPLAAQSVPGWRARVAETMPLLGHRNWILVVDSAYPLQSSPGIEVIETNAPHLEVVHYVLGSLHRSIHVTPIVYMDAELPYVPDEDAPGASAYLGEIRGVLRDYPIQQIPHEKLIETVADTSNQFHVLVLKTTMTVPYSSVFFRLDCKYWTPDAEQRLRQKMSANPPASGEQP